ncbi:hypothetical protein FSP39_024669, partial [Pinctada imbricata]
NAFTGINICHYSYSEAQAGKSYCDSRIAHMRTKMRSYVANGHDILSADDMKTAMDQIPPMKEERQQLKFECPEIGCTKVFASHKTLDRHLILGKHNIKVYRESTYDLIRKQWAKLCNNVVVIVGKRKEIGSENSVSIQGIERGYGLKKAKKVNRFPTSVKVYLEQKFEEGEKVGKSVFQRMLKQK